MVGFKITLKVQGWLIVFLIFLVQSMYAKLFYWSREENQAQLSNCYECNIMLARLGASQGNKAL